MLVLRNQHCNFGSKCTMFSRIICSKLLIEAIKPNVKKEINLIQVLIQNLSFVSGIKNIIQKIRENLVLF